MLPDEQPPAPDGEEKFHVWRLLGVIFVVCVVLRCSGGIGRLGHNWATRGQSILKPPAPLAHELC
jgi:hypothetical protein